MVSKFTTGNRQFNWINLGIIIAMSFGSMTYGYSASIISTTLAQPSFKSYFDLDTRSDATALISTMNGLYQVGGFLGVFSVSWFADKWGRRAAIGVSALITLLSGALLAGSVHVAMFIVFRFFSGAGAFMILSAVPIWMNEVTPPRNRGMLVDIHGAALLFGYMLAAWIGNGFFYLDSPDAWRAALCKSPSIRLIHVDQLSSDANQR
jgi:MFS family permease